MIGLDRELGANFAVGLAYTWRKGTDWNYRPRLRAAAARRSRPSATCSIIQPSEYTQRAPTTANGYTSFTYAPNAALVTAGGGGRLRTNADGYHTTFNGLELTLTKRLSNKWMSRVAFSWNDWTDHWDGTPYALNTDGGNPTRTENDPHEQGGPVTHAVGRLGQGELLQRRPVAALRQRARTSCRGASTSRARSSHARAVSTRSASA